MANHNARGLERITKAFGFSMSGFRECFRHEEAFRQEVYVLLALVPLGAWLGRTGVERALLVGSLLVVPIVELLNSAVEANVDRVGLEKHELSRRAKDVASAAVFLSIVLAGLVWLLVLLPRWPA
ncbi:MAG: diacylglycerol kinase [Gammaproteobacteria bacterium]|jgi:diacylglycerol kinase (ATP)|nr:diacylglycerol kinase [Gammaproteobacteria bacterium]